MSKKNIGATQSIKDNNFTAGIRNAITGVKNLKNHTANATGGLKKIQSQSKLTGEGLASLAKKAAGVVAAYAGFSQMISFGKECITLFDTQARSEQRLETLMMNVKGTTLENVNAMKKYAGELQGITTIGDEATIQGASQLATFQLQSSTIKTLLPSLQDLAVSQYGVSVSGDQMQSMANLTFVGRNTTTQLTDGQSQPSVSSMELHKTLYTPSLKSSNIRLLSVLSPFTSAA